MLTLENFQASLTSLLKNPEQHHFLLAVSGGVDSMVLLHLFQILSLKFEVAHINYKLRKNESDLDQQLVEDFCVKNKIKFHLYGVSEKDRKPKNSIQNWARDLRYNFFREIQKTENLEFLITAHHLNDELETFLINLSKASGIRGLSGIPANENGIIRPLLNFSKEEIYLFAQKNNIAFREDLSNKKNDYLRNFIRNEIAPKLFETNDNFLQNFSKSINYLNQTKNFTEQKILEIEKEIVFRKEHLTFIDKEKLGKQTDFVQFEILRKFGFADEKEISKIFAAETGKIFQSTYFQLIVDRNNLVITEKHDESEKPEKEKFLEINSEQEIIISDFVEEEVLNLNIFKTKHWEFDAEKLKFPLKLRKKKTGDHFYPIGMIGKKKISKFFKDEKIPIFAQQKIWLLCDGNEKILGVIPFRQDRRFCATDTTKNKISIKF